jgi:hypothetical protein
MHSYIIKTFKAIHVYFLYIFYDSPLLTTKMNELTDNINNEMQLVLENARSQRIQAKK